MSKKTDPKKGEETMEQQAPGTDTGTEFLSEEQVDKDLQDSGIASASLATKITMFKTMWGAIVSANRAMFPKVAVAQGLGTFLGMVRGMMLASFTKDSPMHRFASSKTGTILLDTILCQLIVVFGQLMIMGGHSKFTILVDEATRLNQTRIYQTIRIFEIMLSKLPFIGSFMDLPGLGATDNMGVGDMGGAQA